MKFSTLSAAIAISLTTTVLSAQTSEEIQEIEEVLAPTEVEATSNRADLSGAVSSSWSGSAGLGAVITNGNSDTRNIAGTINISKRTDVWRHSAFGSVYNAESDDVESANRFDLGYKLDRDINENLYGFGRLRYDVDDFGNIDGRFAGIVGLGRNFIDTGRVTFSGEAGVGAQSTDFILPIDGEDSDNGAVFYVGLNYANAVTETLTFNSILNLEVADVNTYTVWDNSLDFKVSDRISLNLGLLIRDNSDIVGSAGESTDTSTRWTINYGI